MNETDKIHTSPENLTRLIEYLELDDPVKCIVFRSLILLLPLGSLYVFLGFIVPNNPKAIYDTFEVLLPSYPKYESIIHNYLVVPTELRWSRLVLIAYLSIYFGLWWAYFQSKISTDNKVEKKRLKIQTLRRLLGTTSKQWDPYSIHSEDKLMTDMFRRKGEIGMTVIAILLAGSIIIFDQISNKWGGGQTLSLWQHAILWLGMLSSVVSFVCFMMCVDSLDTMFNRFSNDATRNSLVHHFYSFTINPRYIGTACMLLSMILLLAYHSETLASVGIAVVIWIGYGLWFPNLNEDVIKLGLTPEKKRFDFSLPYISALILFPLFTGFITHFVYT